MMQPLKIQFEGDFGTEEKPLHVVQSQNAVVNPSIFEALYSTGIPNDFKVFRFVRYFSTSTPHLEADALLSKMFLNVISAVPGTEGAQNFVSVIGDFVGFDGKDHVGTLVLNYVYSSGQWSYVDTYFNITSVN